MAPLLRHRHPPPSTRERSLPLASRSPTVRATLVVAAAHFFNDAYASFLAPLLPRIMDKLDLSIAAAAGLAMALSIASSLPQPAVGFLSDRLGRRRFVVLGPLVSGVFLSMMGLAPTFETLLLLLLIGGLGSALFHPPGASVAAQTHAGPGSGLRYSIFSFGGSLGFAVGPLIAVGIVSVRGLEGLWVAMFPAVAASVAVWWLAPKMTLATPVGVPPRPGQVLRLLRGPLGSLFWISSITAFVQRAYLTLQPISVAEAGGSEEIGALSLTVFLGAQAIGTLTGGWLTDRMSRLHLLALLTALGAPLHVLAVALPPGSPGALVFASFAGFVNMAILPPIIVMAQELLPDAEAAGAGIVMGLAWAAGSVGVLIAGAAADVIGPQWAVTLSMPTLLIGTALALGPALRSTSRSAR